jgi:DNA-binding LacI/PurR family transcriptional regulator
MVTMKEIAARLGVSQPTVSLALSGQTKGTFISEATRQRVVAAAKELGYQPNQIARAMVMGRTKVIGFLGATLNHEYTARMLSGVLSIAQSRGYLVKIVQTGNGTSGPEALQQVIQQCLAGVVCVHFDEAFLQEAHGQLSGRSIPMAILDHTVLNLGTRLAPGTRVLPDDGQGVGLAVEHLAALGHSRIAFVSAGGDSAAWAARESGYRCAMRQLNLPVRRSYVRRGKDDLAQFRRMVLDLLTLPERPTAIACATDYMAMVVLRTAREAGLRVPEDLSVIGFADLEMASFADPPLTTVASAFEAMGDRAATRLLAAVEGTSKRSSPGSLIGMVPTRLIVRESTGPVNANGPEKAVKLRNARNTRKER